MASGNAPVSHSIQHKELIFPLRVEQQSAIMVDFNGENDPTVQEFIRQVESTFPGGQGRDAESKSDFASTYLAGAALAWYIDLESSIQADWRLLRLALLRRFGQGPPPNTST